MRWRWTWIAAAVGAAIPLLLLGLIMASVDVPWAEYVFDALIPLMGWIMLHPHDPLIWEAVYALIPIFMISNAVIYGLLGFGLAQVRIWRGRRPKPPARVE